MTANVLGGATLAIPAIVIAAPTIGEVASAAMQRALFGPAMNRVFWSGGTAMGMKAAIWAASTEGSTIETTLAGRGLELMQETLGLGWETMGPMWRAASSMFAQGAQGTVVVFQNSVVSTQSVWGTVEYPILNGNGVGIVPMGW